MVDHFKNHSELLEKYIQVLPKILELRDHIYASLPQAYNSTGGKFGGLKDVNERKKEEVLVFSGEKSKYKIPSAFIYPALAAFRSLLSVNESGVSWKDNPIKFYDSTKVELSQRIVEQATGIQNPTKMGKDKATWGRCYDLIKLEVLERSL